MSTPRRGACATVDALSQLAVQLRLGQRLSMPPKPRTMRLADRQSIRICHSLSRHPRPALPSSRVPCESSSAIPSKPHHCEQIAAAAAEAEVVDAGQERIAEELFAADIFCGHAKVPVDWDGVVRQGRLQWIQSSAAGMDHCLVPSVIESDIVVTSASGVLADQVAEHTIALLTGLVPQPAGLLPGPAEEGVHPPAHPRPDRTARSASSGFGGVGRRLAEVLSAVQDADPGHRHVPGRQARLRRRPLAGRPARRPAGASPTSWCSALPLNETTRGMFDAAALAKMKPGALLVNMARGPLVVSDDLVDGPGSRASGRGGDGRDRSGAAAAGEPALGHAQRDHHAARGRPERLADRQHDRAVLPRTFAAGRPGEPLINS